MNIIALSASAWRYHQKQCYSLIEKFIQTYDDEFIVISKLTAEREIYEKDSIPCTFVNLIDFVDIFVFVFQMFCRYCRAGRIQPRRLSENAQLWDYLSAFRIENRNERFYSFPSNGQNLFHSPSRCRYWRKQSEKEIFVRIISLSVN